MRKLTGSHTQGLGDGKKFVVKLVFRAQTFGRIGLWPIFRILRNIDLVPFRFGDDNNGGDYKLG